MSCKLIVLLWAMGSTMPEGHSGVHAIECRGIFKKNICAAAVWDFVHGFNVLDNVRSNVRFNVQIITNGGARETWFDSALRKNFSSLEEAKEYCDEILRSRCYIFLQEKHMVFA